MREITVSVIDPEHGVVVGPDMLTGELREYWFGSMEAVLEWAFKRMESDALDVESKSHDQILTEWQQM